MYDLRKNGFHEIVDPRLEYKNILVYCESKKIFVYYIVLVYTYVILFTAFKKNIPFEAMNRVTFRSCVFRGLQIGFQNMKRMRFL